MEVGAESEHVHLGGLGNVVEAVALNEIGVSLVGCAQVEGSEGAKVVVERFRFYVELLVDFCGNRDLSKVVDSVLSHVLGLDEVGAAGNEIIFKNRHIANVKRCQVKFSKINREFSVHVSVFFVEVHHGVLAKHFSDLA